MAQRQTDALSSLSLFNLMQRNNFDQKFILMDVRPLKEYNECHIWKSQSQKKIITKKKEKRRIIAIASKSDNDIVSDFIFNDFEGFKKQYPFLVVFNGDLSSFKGMNSSMFSYPSQVLSNLFIGNCLHSSNRKILSDLNITNIVNVTRNMSDCQSIKNDKNMQIEYLRIPITDSMTEQIEKKFRGSAVYIDKILANPQNKLLIHCQHGISRSPSIVIAYFVWKHQWSFDKAFKFVKKRRNIICPNKGFVKKLKDWAKENQSASIDK